MFVNEIAETIRQPTNVTIWNIGLAILIVWITRWILLRNRSSVRRGEFLRFSESHRCAPATALPKPFLGAIRHKLGLLLYPGGDLLDNYFADKFRKYGPTHALLNRGGLPVVIHTIDPVNINAILNRSSDDWGPSKARARTMYPLAQEGLLNSEGASWHKNRKMILRHIFTKRAKDVRNSEADVQLLFDAIGPVDQDGWTQEVDLLDLFHRLSLDMSTTFLLGTSANSQLSAMRDARMRAAMAEFDLIPSKHTFKLTYGEAYEVVRDYFSWRSKLGSKYWIADGPRVRQTTPRDNLLPADDDYSIVEHAAH